MVGGFTTASDSGAGCRDLVLCGQNPVGPEKAAVESLHRIVAWIEGFLVLSLLVLVLWRYRSWGPVRNLTILAFVLVVVQGALGMLSVAATFNDFDLGTAYPAFVTAHLGVATAFLAVAVLNAALAMWAKPPASVVARDAPPSPDPA